MAAKEEFTPETLDEAAALLLATQARVRPSREGTKLIGQARDGGRTRTIVLHLARLAELNRLDYEERSGLRIGAAVPYAQLLEFPPVRRLYPVLADGCAEILRARGAGPGTPGGSLSHRPPCPDIALPLSCLGASAAIFGPHGWSELAVEALAGPADAATLQPGEFVVQVRLPPPIPRSGSAYLRSTGEADDLPGGAGMAAVLVMEEDLVTCCGLRLMLCSPPGAPVRAPAVERFLAGRRLDATVLEEASASAARLAVPPGVGEGGECRRRVARLVRHTILEALTRVRAASML